MNRTLLLKLTSILPLCLLIGTFAWTPSFMHAQILFNYTNASSGAPNSTDPNIGNDPLTRGGGVSSLNLNCIGATDGFGSTHWPTTNTFNVATFNQVGDFVQVKIWPDPGYGMKATGFSARLRRENQTGTANDGPIGIRYALRNSGSGGWTSGVNPGNPQISNVCSSLGTLRTWTSFPVQNVAPGDTLYIRIYGLSSGSAFTGDLFMQSVVVTGETCAAPPTITPAPDFFAVCAGETEIDFEYSAANGQTYTISYDDDPDAVLAGFTNQSGDLNDAGGTITLNIPQDAPAGYYDGVFTVENSCGFTSEYAFTVYVKPLPDVSVAVMPLEICAEESVTLTFTDNAASGNLFTILADLTDDRGLLTDEVNYNGIPSGASDTYTEGADFFFAAGGMVSLSNIRVTDETTGCSTTVEDLSIQVHPLPVVTITGDEEICDGESTELTATGGGTYEWSTGATTASISVDESGIYSVTVTSDEGCETTESFGVTVHPLPEPVITITPEDICPGGTVTLNLDVTNYDETTFNISGSLNGNEVSFSGVSEGDITTWTAGVDFNGDLTFSGITVTETATGCSATLEGSATVNVYDAPIFGFSASSNSDPGGTVSNADGPATITVDFCAGNSLTLSLPSENGNLGYIGQYTSSGNVTYDGNLLVPGPVNFTVVPSDGTFFNNVYGGALGYGLNSGTYGTITQVFTPFLDTNNDNDYDEGIDCLGDPITLVYRIYGPIVLNVTRVNDANICSGGTLEYSFATTSTENIIFDISVDPAVNGANPAVLTDDNALPFVFPGAVANSGAPHTILQTLNNADGTFDRGRVNVTVSNVRYVDTDVNCGVTINSVNTLPTRVYPKPRLDAVDDLLICTGSNAQIDLTLTGGGPSSLNANTAGYPVRVDWTLSAPDLLENGASGTTVIYNNLGADVSTLDIDQILTLIDNNNGPQTAVFTITPRAAGNTNPFNGDDCYGDPITVEVTVVPPSEPTIEGPTCLHAGSTMVLTGTPNVQAPAVVEAEVWSSSDNLIATVDENGVVTGVGEGVVTITYAVTDDAGCVTEVEHEVTVLSVISLTLSAIESPVGCGDDVKIVVEASNVCDLAVLNFDVNWDSDAFSFAGTVTSNLPGFEYDDEAGVVHFSWSGDPFAFGEEDQPVVLCFYLSATANSGTYSVYTTNENAENSNESEIGLEGGQVEIEILPLSITGIGDVTACPTDEFVALSYCFENGEADNYVITFEDTPPFPLFDGSLLDPDEEGCGTILINLPGGLLAGHYPATIQFFNENGCESQLYAFDIIIDENPPVLDNPAIQEIDCIDDIPSIAAGEQIIRDLIDAAEGEPDDCTERDDLDIVYDSETYISGSGCAGDPYTIERYYQVYDEAGNSTTVTITFQAEDDEPPVLSDDFVLSGCFESEQAVIDYVNDNISEYITDNCSDAGVDGLLINLNDESGCYYTVSIVLVDECGNASGDPYTFQITIDDTAPVLTDGAILDDCYEILEDNDPETVDAVQDAIAVTLEYMDDCSELTVTNVDVIDLLGPCEYLISVTVADECGHEASAVYQIRVDDTEPPLLSSNPDALEFTCYTNIEDAIAAAAALTSGTDNCSQTVTVDGYFEYSDEENCLGTVFVTVTDECGNVATVPYPNIRIDDVEPSVPEGVPAVSCFMTAEDAEQAVIDYVRSIVIDCTPVEDLLITAVYQEVEDEESDCESGIVYVTVEDCAGNTNEFPFEYPVDIDNDDPVFEEPEAIIVDCLDDIPLPYDGIVASDFNNCSEVEVELIGEVIPLECGAENGGYRIYQATDCAGNTAIVTQQIIFLDEEAPEWVDEDASLTLACDCDDAACIDDLLQFIPATTDNGCFGVIPVLVSYTDELDGCTRIITRVWTASDYCGNQIATNFTQTILIVDDEAPTFNPNCQFMPPLVLSTSNLLFDVACPQEAEIIFNGLPLTIGQELNPTQTWSVAGAVIQPLAELDCVLDNCTAEEDIIVRVENIEVDDDVTGFVINNEMDPQDFPCARLITLTLEFRDACGNVNEDDFVCQYLIIDDEAPVVTTTQNLNRNISCDDNAALTIAMNLEPSFADNCDEGELDIDYWQTLEAGDCPQEYTLTRYWTATDCANNTSTPFAQVITVYDNEGPTWATQAGALDVSVTCNDAEELEAAQALAPEAEDNCSGMINLLKTTGVLVPGTCPGTGTITNTWTATDECGNPTTSVFTQVITIVDDVQPIVEVGSIADCYTSVAAAEAAALAATSGIDNCSDVTKTVSTTGTCDAVVTVTVTDCAGNPSVVTFNTRIDNVPPTVTAGTINACYPTLVLAEAAAKAATIRSDNCPGTLGIVATTSGTCPATITVTVTDGCGNSASVQYNNICIGLDGSVQITTQASNSGSSCENQANELGAWLANNGGAVATGTGIEWTYSPVVFGTVDCMTHSRTATVTFTATDDCGYSAQTTASFTVTDNTPPSAAPIQPTNLTCSTQIPAPNTGLVTGLSDNCDTELTVALFLNSNNNGSGCPGNPLVILRTYSVTDDFCNTTYVTHTITVVDNVAPTFTAPANTTVFIDANCNYNASPAVTGDVTNEMDNCSNGLNATYSDQIANGQQAPVRYIITRTWTLSDNCSNTAASQVQTINVVDNIVPTISCPANVSVTGGMVESNSCAWVGVGLAPTYNDNCNPPTLTYSLNGFFTGNSTGTGAVNGRTFLEGTTTITYTVTDPAGNTATCSFTVNINCTTISGRLIWEHDDVTGVGNATVRLTQGMTLVNSMTTPPSGDYTVIPTGTGVHTITPVKNINRLNGVTAFDAYLIQQHLIGTPFISDPYKKIAADVNRSGFITTQDANLINQAIAGDPAALAVFNVFWRFVPTSHTISPTSPNVVPAFPENITVNVTGPDITGQNFFGIKIGDVNGSANPANLPAAPPLVWMVKDEILQAGKTYELSFDAQGFDQLVAFQFALDFDPSHLTFEHFESTGAISADAFQFGAYNADLGELRVVWSNATALSLSSGTPVFKLRFKALESGMRLSEALKLDPSLLEAQVYNEMLSVGDVKVVFVSSTNTGNPGVLTNPALQLFQNQPNPFKEVTMIGFVLPEACQAQIRVLDVSGRELAIYNRQYTAGYHEIEFRMANAAAYGVLYYELTTPFGKLSKKMITGGH